MNMANANSSKEPNECELKRTRVRKACVWLEPLQKLPHTLEPILRPPKKNEGKFCQSTCGIKLKVEGRFCSLVGDSSALWAAVVVAAVVA